MVIFREAHIGTNITLGAASVGPLDAPTPYFNSIFILGSPFLVKIFFYPVYTFKKKYIISSIMLSFYEPNFIGIVDYSKLNVS